MKTNKLNKLFIATVLVIGLSVYSCNEQRDLLNDGDITLRSAETIPTATITIDENSVIKEAGKSMLGLNYEWGYNPMFVTMESGYVLDVSQDCINVLKSAGVRLPLNRMAGTSSQWMKWKEAIGPLADRTQQGSPAVKQRMGVVEWITLVRSIDPSAEFVLVLNYETETTQDYADLAEFLTGDGSVNINGGENWAQKRIELGITEPVKVAIWELGNEMDHRAKSIYKTPEPYIEKSREAITAIKGVCPDARFAAVGATSPWNSGRDWRGWNTAVLQGLGNQIDYLTFHPYYARVQSAMNNMENYMNEMKQQILTSTGSDRIKLYVSEHGVWPSNLNDQTTGTQTKDLKGTLATGAFIGRLFKRTDVAFSTTHAFSAGPWGVIFLNRAARSRYTSGIADMTKAFYDAVGEKVIRASLAGKDTVNLETTAMLTDNGMNLVIFNLEPGKKRDLKFKFGSDDAYKLVKEVIVTADALDAYNTLGNKKITTTETLLSDHNAFTKYLMPEKSMVVLYLEKRPAE
ncbi:MAG: hypothetical protein LLF81_04725 [Porphyromonadaceae bacterium]|nr:hypothetical protein [Porphyromonadaceae bacterium]